MFQRILLFGIFILSCFPCKANIRFSTVSGQFYSASPLTLRSDIEKYLSQVQKQPDISFSKIIGMIVPHAGYQYSGKTAAYVYNFIKDHPVDVVVILGPYHAHQFQGVSIWTEGSWRTPLGEVAIDEELAKNIQSESIDFSYDRQIHELEHSIEVQLPFLQTVAKKTKIVPILISDIKYAKPLAQALFKHLQGRSVYVIASTDLSHYHTLEEAAEIDQKTQDILKILSPTIFCNALEKREIELCGAAAVLTLLELSQLSSSVQLIPLHYAHSGKTSYDKTDVVGYNASLIMVAHKISKEQTEVLLNLAKDTLYARLTNKEIPRFVTEDITLTQPHAVFVTLRDRQGKLRGCMGRLQAEEPLYQAVQNMTIEAATKDLRFLPISFSEVKDISIEISVLNSPEPVRSAQEIIAGTHGVIVSQGEQSGVFLPEVWADFSTKEAFLSELCHQKARLPYACWRDPDTQLSVFTTQTLKSQKQQ